MTTKKFEQLYKTVKTELQSEVTGYCHQGYVLEEK